jgi:hypothetical protein
LLGKSMLVESRADFRYDAPVLLPCGLAVLAVVLGLALGLTRSRALVGPLRSFALSAALVVVVSHLVPEALSELGAPGLFVFTLSLVGPAWIRLVRAEHEHSHGGHGALGAGYAGLMLHHVGDGLGLGAYTSLPGGALAHFSVLLALVVHTVPLVAVVTFAYRSVGGARAALTRSAGLALASVLGVLASGLVPEELSHRLSAWIAAAVAGLLLHVVTHDLARDLPASILGRAADWFGAALGVGVSVFGSMQEHAEHAGHAEHAEHAAGPAAALLEVALTAAPALLLALALLAFVRAPEGPLGRAAASLFGPARGFDGLVLAALLIGPAFGLGYAAGSLVVLGVVVGARWLAHDEVPSERALRLAEYGPWLVTGVVLAAVLKAGLSAGALVTVPAPLALLVAALSALPARIPVVAAVPVAAALIERGLYPGAALALVLLGPLPVVSWFERAPRASDAVRLSFSAAALGALVAVLVGFGLGHGLSLVALLPPAFSLGFLALVLVPLLPVAWSRGPRGFVASVFPSHDTAST